MPVEVMVVDPNHGLKRHLLVSAGRGVLEKVSAVSFCQEMAFVAAISQVKDCYKIL